VLYPDKLIDEASTLPRLDFQFAPVGCGPGVELLAVNQCPRKVGLGCFAPAGVVSDQAVVKVSSRTDVVEAGPLAQ
jgi:hypothetical protein